MIRILLPLAIVAAMFFGPMYSYESYDPVSRQKDPSEVYGHEFMGGVISCVRELKVPIGEDCSSDRLMNDSKMVSSTMSLAAIISLLAAGFGVVGLLPFVGRLTSVVTIAAGLASLASMSFMVMAVMGSEIGLGGVQWGAYLTAGLALLTTISGLSGMRGR